MDFREVFEDFHHAVVILQRVHSRPRQPVFSGDQILVKGLVHVPKKADVDMWHQRTKKLRTGAGGSVPRIARQRISFNSSSSARSASERSILAERAAAAVVCGFRSSSGHCGSTDTHGAGCGVLSKAAHIGSAAASKCVMGRRPRISSMVRSTEVVLYMLLSITPRRVYGDRTKTGDRWESTWSGPFWASSSRTKIAVCGQNFDFDTASTMSPSARSLSAIADKGATLPGATPEV